MAHTVEWQVHLHLFEDEGTTKARAVVETGANSVVGNGLARCNPNDRDIPEIGDELAAGRAMRDIAQQLLGEAQRDIESVNAPAQQGAGEPWPM
ncbi:DUF1876 domain-containing protein [Streptomyces sp. TS71-3]|uniref:DUF1876 domain-containing protein n=1 Tax=Streptomyces sp. TS71-3 TaxID=2733862 RepID=UPI001B25061B|nr:DUF1876 domain-containing protein [Streptomyces sp. TS71-3]GHJ39272.1 hypothetical protein Sm713_48810 [Streptomyces sp. TS71-3]